MNPTAIFKSFNTEKVAYLVLGGFNFLVAHKPILTFDIDIWIEDTPENRLRCARALVQLGAAWGPTESSWKPVTAESDWLRQQPLFCLTTTEGALDIFRDVRGLEGQWHPCRERAVWRKTPEFEFWGLSDLDMLACQLALDLSEQKQDRIAILRRALHHQGHA